MSHDGEFSQPPKQPEFKVGQRFKQGTTLFEVTGIGAQGVTIKIVREQVRANVGNRKFRRAAAKNPIREAVIKTMQDKMNAIHELPEEEQEAAFGKLMADQHEEENNKRQLEMINKGTRRMLPKPNPEDREIPFPKGFFVNPELADLCEEKE